MDSTPFGEFQKAAFYFPELPAITRWLVFKSKRRKTGGAQVRGNQGEFPVRWTRKGEVLNKLTEDGRELLPDLRSAPSSRVGWRRHVSGDILRQLINGTDIHTL